jgi:hypothetical protein
MESMNHQQDRAGRNGANRNPAFFGFDRVITLRDGERIVEHESSRLKTDIVFAEIPLTLMLIPLEAHDQRTFLSSVTP